MDKGAPVVGSMDAYAQSFESVTNKFFAPAKEAFPRPFDPLFAGDNSKLDSLSAADVIKKLDLSTHERDLISTFAAMNGHSNPEQSSYLDQLRWFALGDFNLWNLWDNLGRYRVKGGTRVLLDHMQNDNGSEVIYSSPVQSVVQSHNRVTVTTKAGSTYVARSVVVALPLNCLNDIDFTPKISSTKQRVSEARHTGSGIKIYARTRKKYPIFLGHGNYQMPLCFLFTEYDDDDDQLLVGFGVDPDRLDIHNSEAISAAMLQFVPNLEIGETLSHDWNQDPYARGTWCMYRPNTLTNDLSELQRSEGNVYFAGADIASGWRGFIDGAIESGMRTARQVADNLG